MKRLFTTFPNTCAYFGLGWIKLECFIQVKKLLFLKIIPCAVDVDVPKRVFAIVLKII